MIVRLIITARLIAHIEAKKGLYAIIAVISVIFVDIHSIFRLLELF